MLYYINNRITLLWCLISLYLLFASTLFAINMQEVHLECHGKNYDASKTNVLILYAKQKDDYGETQIVAHAQMTVYKHHDNKPVVFEVNGNKISDKIIFLATEPMFSYKIVKANQAGSSYLLFINSTKLQCDML